MGKMAAIMKKNADKDLDTETQKTML